VCENDQVGMDVKGRGGHSVSKAERPLNPLFLVIVFR
jgi:hypothetical protein